MAMHRFRQFKWDENDNNLIQLKDQQIRRLNGELQAQKRRADNAVKMFESFRAIHTHQDTQINERVKRVQAQKQVTRLRARNKQLQQGIEALIAKLKEQQAQ